MTDNPSELRIILDGEGDDKGTSLNVDLAKELKGLADAVLKGGKQAENAAKAATPEAGSGTTPSPQAGGGGRKKPPKAPPAAPSPGDERPSDPFSQELIALAESLVASQETLKEASNSLRDSMSAIDLDIQSQVNSQGAILEALGELPQAMGEQLAKELSLLLGANSPSSTGFAKIDTTDVVQSLADAIENMQEAFSSDVIDTLSTTAEELSAIAEIMAQFAMPKDEGPETFDRGPLYGLTSGARTAQGAAGSVAAAAAAQAAESAASAAVRGAAAAATKVGFTGLATLLGGPLGSAIATGLAAAVGGAVGNAVSETISAISSFAGEMVNELKNLNETVAMQQAINDFNNLQDAINRGNDVGEETAALMEVQNDFTLAAKSVGTELFRIFGPFVVAIIAVLTAVLRIISFVLYPIGLLVELVMMILQLIIDFLARFEWAFPGNWLAQAVNLINRTRKFTPSEEDAISAAMAAEEQRMADIAAGLRNRPGEGGNQQ